MTPIELPAAVAVSLLVTGIGLMVWGGLLVWRTVARTTGVLMGLAGSAAVLAVVLESGGRAVGFSLGVAGECLALAVMAYPRARPDWPTVLAVVALIVCPSALWALGVVSHGSDVALVIAAVPLLQLWWRLEAADPTARKVLAWLLAACVTVAFAGFVLGMLGAPPLVVACYLPSFLLVGWAAWIGATRPGALDVRGVVAAIATNTLAAVAVFAAFQLCVLALRSLGADTSALPVAGLVAVGIAFALGPLRAQLRLVAEELLFGIRPDPREAAGRVALGAGDDAQTALDTLRTALVLPFAELRIDGLAHVSSGVPGEHVHREPLRVSGRRVGELVVGLRPGDFRLSAADTTVLALAGPLLAQTVRARALAEGLQQSRAATAAAREEERRRLRRDLHDGLGPRLSGIAFTADAARLSTEEPDLLAAHLSTVRSEAVTAIQEIRELVYGLRPPALDEVGLVEAVRLQATGLHREGGRPMRVDIVSRDIAELPAAVEVAAYRIVVEALTNSARHSDAERACASLRVVDRALHITVEDTGRGAGPWTPGVGLTSMAERAQELGGTLSVAHGAVRAVLPL